MTPFAELGIHPNILQGLEALGFTAPTPVQERVIPLMLSQGHDLISLAQTGTGKTAAFGVPLLQLLQERSALPQGLILCPTRELCVQVAKDLHAYAKYMPGVQILPVYGGADIKRQINGLQRGADIIVATPGRLHDLMRRGVAKIAGIHTVVLDEADEMLKMGFLEELDAILAQTPADKRTLLFSATMSKPILSIAGRYMKDIQEVTIGQRNRGAENVRHQFYMVAARNRYPALKRLIDSNPGLYSIIFCRTRQETRDIADKLAADGYRAEALHGELSQSQRDQVMKKFRSRNLEILVATDVAARGLDVNDLTHVINYNMPDDIANYTHRSGRTGRAGKTGISIAIINLRERFIIKEIEKRLGQKFEQERLPSGSEICRQRLFAFVDQVKEVEVDQVAMAPIFEDISQKLAGLDRDELIKKFISRDYNKLLNEYKNAPDLNETRGPSPKPSARPGNKQAKIVRKEPLFTRFHINVGKKDGVLPQRLISEINASDSMMRIRIGRIEINNNFSLLEADSRFTSQVMKAFQGLSINGKPVSIGIAPPRRPGFKSQKKSTPKKMSRKSRMATRKTARKSPLSK